MTRIRAKGGARNLARILGVIVRRNAFSAMYTQWLRFWGVRVGRGCRFHAPIRIIGDPRRIEIGDRASLHRDVCLWTHDYGGGHGRIILHDDVIMLRGVTLNSYVGISVGSHSAFGDGCYVQDNDHGTASGTPMMQQPSHGTPIDIGEDVWFGARCIVLKGVTVGAHTVVGAGSVVVKSLPSGVVAAGVPCRVIKPRDAKAVAPAPPAEGLETDAVAHRSRAAEAPTGPAGPVAGEKSPGSASAGPPRPGKPALLLRDLFVNGIAAWPVFPGRLRRTFYNVYGMRIETNGISPGCFFGGPGVSIGDRTTVNYRCFFDALARVRIGRDCAIGMEVLFCSSTHELGSATKRAGLPAGRPIVVGDGCWIGARAVLTPGVTVGDGCVVAAGAVVTRDCAPDGMYAGAPARRVRDLPGGMEIEAGRFMPVRGAGEGTEQAA